MLSPSPRRSRRAAPAALLLLAILAFLLGSGGGARPTPARAAAPTALLPCAGDIAPGTTMTCAISVAAEADSITLSGTSGEVYLLRVAVTAGDMRPLVQLRAPDSSTACQASSPYAAGAEIARCVLAQSGAQTIRISDTAGTRTGSYNLYVQRLSAPASPTPLIIGDTHIATISTGAEASTFSLTGDANAAFLLRMGVTAGSLRPIVRVFASDGSTLCSASQPYAAGAEISRCVLPQAGTYTVLAADTSAVQTGSYNLYVQRLTDPAGATALSWAETTPAALAVAAELDSYTVQAAANDVLLLRAAVTAGSMRPIARVFDPDGVELCGVAQPYALGAEITRCAIPRAGSYLVVVGDTSAAQTGSYNLYVQRLTDPIGPQDIYVSAPLSGTIQAPAEADTFRWSAGASDRLQVTVTATSGELRPGVRIFDPAGTRVCEALSPYSTKAEIADCLLPRSGTYTVLVGDASATKTGSYQVALSCLSSACGTGAAPLQSHVYLPLLRR